MSQRSYYFNSFIQYFSENIRLILHRQVIILFFLGLSAGLPLLLIFSSLSAWLMEAGVSRSTITFFSWASLGYSFKYIWAPLVDNTKIFGIRSLGRRRSWLLFSQMLIMASILAISLQDPAYQLFGIAVATVCLGFSSATQDIVIDAYRIESGTQDTQAMMTASYVLGYRIAMIISGAGSLFLAQYLGSTLDSYSAHAWSLTYMAMAGMMMIGVLTTLIMKEPENEQNEKPVIKDQKPFILTFLLFIGVFVFCNFYFFPKILPSQNHHVVVNFLLEALSLFMSIGLGFLCVLFMMKINFISQSSVSHAFIQPVESMIKKHGHYFILIIALITTQKISDITMGSLANVFYLDMNYSKIDIAQISKFYGLIATIAGGFLGGFLCSRMNLINLLLLGSILSTFSNIVYAQHALAPDNIIYTPIIFMCSMLMFLVLRNRPEKHQWINGLKVVLITSLILLLSYQLTHHSQFKEIISLSYGRLMPLTAMITFDNVASGLSSVAMVAYLSALTNTKFTSTQYAIFSSILLTLPKIFAGYSGQISMAIGYEQFFYLTVLLGLPSILILSMINKFHVKLPEK